MIHSIVLFLKGIVLGIAVMLPGMSGGTMAFVMGIYQKLIFELSKINIKHIQHLLLYLSCKKKLIKKATDFLKKHGILVFSSH